MLRAQPAEPSLKGDWVNVYELAGSKEYARMSLQQSETAVTGTSGIFKLTGTVRNGKIEIQGTGDHRSMRASGLIDGDRIKGTAWIHGDDRQWFAYRENTRQTAPAMHTFEPTEFHVFFSGSIPPALRINSGDTVKTWTVDAAGWDAAGKRRSSGPNPETGPFYIEGALPGDVLAIKLNRVRLNRNSAIHSSEIVASALDPYYHADLERIKDFNSDWTLDREQGIARLKEPTGKLKGYTVPLQPMLGCIGVAPPDGMTLRSTFPGKFGGNMDYSKVREGVTIYLPVFQPGALLFIGDGHGAQGDAELTGDALETSMDVEFTVNLLRGAGETQDGPRAEDDEYLMAMGIGRSLDEGLQNSTTEMSKWLSHDYGLNSAEVAVVLGTAMRYDIAEVVDPYVNVVAKVSKKALAPLVRVSATATPR
jgi:amidase